MYIKQFVRLVKNGFDILTICLFLFIGACRLVLI